MHFINFRVNIFFQNFYPRWETCGRGDNPKPNNLRKNKLNKIFRASRRFFRTKALHWRAAEAFLGRWTFAEQRPEHLKSPRRNWRSGSATLANFCALPGVPEFRENVGLPPFPADPPILSETGAVCELFLTEIPMPEIPPEADPKSETERAYGAARREIDARLLEIEGRLPRALALFGGSCRNCPLPACPRERGLPAPRPQFMRPSLEALGFDVSAAARKSSGRSSEWRRIPGRRKKSDSDGGAARAALS